ncbi:TMV resistance protein N-like [Dorcoceras hygrometricum]|uniref:TMV resistance protein N-like n=1 Tax=Dorcoceras hygrometricum TaxID=472368 RepID=A0A2Z7CCI6_9LAMI|nr:TMV resistance protein N-like [Dorcoceras hygrometricum]
MFLVDWAVKMRIRPPEFETSICDARCHRGEVERLGRGYESRADVSVEDEEVAQPSVPLHRRERQLPQMPQSSSHQIFKPRGNQFKKSSSSGSSGSDSSGGGSSRAVFCGQCGQQGSIGGSLPSSYHPAQPRDQDFSSLRRPDSEDLLNLSTRDISGLSECLDKGAR